MKKRGKLIIPTQHWKNKTKLQFHKYLVVVVRSNRRSLKVDDDENYNNSE